jgi:hypothetical protein
VEFMGGFMSAQLKAFSDLKLPEASMQAFLKAHQNS